MFSKVQKIILVVLCIILVALVLMLFILPKRYILVVQPGIESVSVDDIIEIGEDAEFAPYVNKVELVPAPILQSFIAGDWFFIVDEAGLAELSEESGKLWGGATDYIQKRVSVSMPDSVLHEFGHYLDYALGFPAQHTTLHLNEARVSALTLGNYSATNSREYFAEYFAFWISNKGNAEAMGRLEASAPETYRYFEELEADSWGLNTKRVSLRPRPSVTTEELYARWEEEARAWNSQEGKSDYGQ